MPMLLTKLMAAGLGSGLANAFCADTADSQTATGTNQATAFETSTAFVRFTTVASGTGCLLDNGARGDSQFIINAGANALSVYPHVGGSINQLGTNAAFSIPAGSWAAFDRYTDTLWTAANDAASSSFVQSGTGASTRTVQAKARDEWHIKDFGAVCDGVTDDSAAIALAEAARPIGSTLIFDKFAITASITATQAGVWRFRGNVTASAGCQILLATSNFVLDGGKSTFTFVGGATSDLRRAVRISGGLSAEHTVTGNIAVGATSFTASSASDAATLSNGDWIILIMADVTNWIQTEAKQVLSVTGGTTVNLTTPVVQAFDGTWTNKWVKVATLRDNVRVQDLNIIIPTTGNDHIGLDGQPGVVNSEISGCTFNIAQGLAFQCYGWINPTVRNNTIIRQQGRQCAWSSNTGGLVEGNRWLEGVASSTAGAITIETGTFGTVFLGNHFFGGNAGSQVVYVNDAHHCTFDDNLIVGNGSNIGILVIGGFHNKIGSGNVIVNSTEGVTIQKDAVLTPNMNTDFTQVTWTKFKNVTTAVSIKDSSCNKSLVLLDTDSATVTTPLTDNGTATVSIQRNNTVVALSFVGGVHLGNVANTNANVLDFYAENTAFTPSVTFGTVGDLAVTYTTQTGTYTRVGNRIFFDITILTSAFTYTTASGNFLIAGLPFAPRAATGVATLRFSGWTKANYSQVTAQYAASDTRLVVKGIGSGQAQASYTTTDVPTGATLDIKVSGHYDV